MPLSIEDFDNFIRDLQSDITSVSSVIERVKNIKKPLSQNGYTSMFNAIERNMDLYSTIKQRVETINNLMSQLEKKQNELTQEVNSNKFKFGLQGQLKNQIKNTQNIRTLPPHIQEIVNDPIVPTPFENRGGKKKRKQTRKRRKTF